MKQRAISAIGVALVGLLPAILGGPVWLIVFTLLCLVGYQEFVTMGKRIEPGIRPYGLAIIPVIALSTYAQQPELLVFGVIALAVAIPLVDTILRADLGGAIRDWSIGLAGTLYLGLPVFAAIQLRNLPGSTSASWLNDLADTASLAWSAYPRGLGWLLSIILVTWMSDTFAYLVGKNLGRRKLTAIISPNKTIEGFIGGTVAAGITSVLTFRIFGIDERFWLAILFGVAIAIVALFGDLAESVIKRSSGVKDSGNIIPGHGGMLDRLDALLFTFVAGWYLALAIDSYIL